MSHAGPCLTRIHKIPPGGIQEYEVPIMWLCTRGSRGHRVNLGREVSYLWREGLGRRGLGVASRTHMRITCVHVIKIN